MRILVGAPKKGREFRKIGNYFVQRSYLVLAEVSKLYFEIIISLGLGFGGVIGIPFKLLKRERFTKISKVAYAWFIRGPIKERC